VRAQHDETGGPLFRLTRDLNWRVAWRDENVPFDVCRTDCGTGEPLDVFHDRAAIDWRSIDEGVGWPSGDRNRDGRDGEDVRHRQLCVIPAR
jgi:hypothetical protein